MQRIFTEYKQPFAITYLGVSLMVVYLPIAILKNWICSFLNKDLLKLCNNDSIMSSSSDLDVPLRINELQQGPTSDKDLREREEGQPFNSRNEEDEPQLLEYDVEPNSWEIAKCSFYLAPIWFTTEVVDYIHA